MIRGKKRPEKKAKVSGKRSIQLRSGSYRKKRARKYSVSRTGRRWGDIGRFLDRQVSVRLLLKYSGIVLAFIAILIFVFLLGRFSVADENDVGTNTILSSSKQTMKTDSSDIRGSLQVKETVSSQETGIDDASSENYIDTDVNNRNSDVPEEYVYETAPVVVGGSVDAPALGEVVECEPKNVEFDHKYTNVLIDVSDFRTERKGDNWAVITSLTLSVTNNEECVIISPTQIKIKMNNKGKGSTWWDDEVFLPDSFKRMKPGDSVTETIPVHVSYADIYMEKDFRLYLLDEYGIEIGIFKDDIKLG